MATIDRAKIREAVKKFLLELLEDEVEYTQLCDVVLESVVNPTHEELPDKEWDKAQAFIDEALHEYVVMINEILA